LIQGAAAVEPYRPPPRVFEGRGLPAPSNRSRHARVLQSQLESASAAGVARRPDGEPLIPDSVRGIYVTFRSFPGIELAFERLDPRVGHVHPELRSVREVVVNDQTIDEATVFIPDGKLGYFLQRIEQYAATVSAEKPRNLELVDRIESIGLASLQQLWMDPPSDFPTGDDPVWWEVWLRRRDEQEPARLRAFAEASNLQVGARTLAFSDRVMMLFRATPAQLATALDVLDDLAELRHPRRLAETLAMEPAAEQAEWVQDVLQRTQPSGENSPFACIVDTGVHQAHPLLEHSLQLSDCHACDPAWNVTDHHGHGTEMAGLALYGDVGAAVDTNGPIRLRHGLESVKFLPPTGQNPQELWGAITATAASLVEIEAPDRRRVFSVATTSDLPGRSDSGPSIKIGQPSSWSAAVDALAAGLAIETGDDGFVYLDPDVESEKRLFLIAGGNIDDVDDDYLARCDIEPVEDPGQSWNAVTVGAYTNLTTFDPTEPGYDGWAPVAEAGELAQCSRTSVPFNRAWPPKPDVLFEGGNVARSPSGDNADTPYAFQLLTTRRPTADARLFTVTSQTSAATAQGAHLAASISAEYPNLGPETVRALMVHSARWTPPMRARFDAANTREQRDALRRRYGMGVPALDRALHSATDALTLVVEDVIRPFDGNGRMREMHLHALPWPTEALLELGGEKVEMRVTLSYFIEPNPGSRGWVRRYSYASHGLRFDVRRVNESSDDFRKRINQLARAEEERRPAGPGSDSAQWMFGPDLRSSGSVHSDIWRGTAADLADRSAIAVYPVTGWWKERPTRDRSERGARYALIVSIETTAQNVDIWTPVAQEVGIPIIIET
jgi:Subtilase family